MWTYGWAIVPRFFYRQDRKWGPYYQPGQSFPDDQDLGTYAAVPRFYRTRKEAEKHKPSNYEHVRHKIVRCRISWDIIK